MMKSQGARVSLAFLLLRAAATADAFRAITPSPPPQQRRSAMRAPATTCTVLPAVPSFMQPQRRPYSHTDAASATSPTLLRSSSSESSDEISAENSSESIAETSEGDGGVAVAKLEKKIAARKKRVEIGYQTVAAAYALVSCISFVKYRFYEPIPIPYALYITAGPWMASATALHLVGSGSNDRLNTGACKRLNLALASFGFIGLLAKDIVTTARPLWVFACLIAMINSIKGYGYGLKGWDLKMTDGNGAALKDIVGGALTSLQDVFALPAVFSRSAGYAALTVTFGAMKAATLYKFIALASAGPMTKMAWIPLAFQYKKLLLLTMATFTLKEAVDQESPKGWGATPVGLGLATAVATGSMAAYSISQGSLYLGGWIALLATFSTVDSINRWTTLNYPLRVVETRVK